MVVSVPVPLRGARWFLAALPMYRGHACDWQRGGGGGGVDSGCSCLCYICTSIKFTGGPSCTLL